jgi:glycine/D-amino acid oxidase-like deaminating enzyme
MKASRKHAIVLGGSMAGLGTARALVNHFDRVTLVERDELPTGTANRKGVPQGQHAHGLLPSGYRVLAHYFPKMMDELVADGAILGDLTGGVPLVPIRSLEASRELRARSDRRQPAAP